MLSIRLAIFAGLFAVALSGLFWLLHNLGEPELLRSPKSAVVKGCDPMESDAARRLCPQFFCQKSVLDAKLVPVSSRFEVTVDTRDAARHLIGGLARPLPPAGELHFACLLEGGKVVATRIVDAARMDQLAAQPGDWTLE